MGTNSTGKDEKREQRQGEGQHRKYQEARGEIASAQRSGLMSGRGRRRTGNAKAEPQKTSRKEATQGKGEVVGKRNEEEQREEEKKEKDRKKETGERMKSRYRNAVRETVGRTKMATKERQGHQKRVNKMEREGDEHGEESENEKKSKDGRNAKRAGRGPSGVRRAGQRGVRPGQKGKLLIHHTIAQPTEKHLHTVKRIFQYLRGTVNRGLWYTKDSLIALTAFADADHAGCQDTRRSTYGSMQFLGDRLVRWSSKRQKSAAISSTEAE
ncbi:hypothetical protein Tco_0826194 [Tanacetum coccineum]